jgi:hypothetical protein
MATVVTAFVQPYKPIAETPSSAHTARAARAGAASAGAAIARAASAGAASAGAASAGAASAEPASKQNPTQLRAAYSRLLKEFPVAQTGDRAGCVPASQHARDFAIKEAGCTVFSKINMRKGYHQIPVNPEDVQKTAITILFSLFEYKRMPFGLRNAGPSFQQHVDRAI